MTVRTALIRGLTNATQQSPAKVAGVIDALCEARPHFKRLLDRPAPPGMLEDLLSDPDGIRAFLAQGHAEVVAGQSTQVRLYPTQAGPIVYLDGNCVD